MKKAARSLLPQGVVSRNARRAATSRATTRSRCSPATSTQVLARSGIPAGRDRDAPPRACRPGGARARGRQARVRREAARDHLGASSIGSSTAYHGARAAAAADGRIQPPVLAGPDRCCKELIAGTPRAADDRVPAERRLHPARSLGAWPAGRRPQHRRSVPHVRRVPLPGRRAGALDSGRRNRSGRAAVSPQRQFQRDDRLRGWQPRAAWSIPRSARRPVLARSTSRCSATARPTSSTISSS